MENQTKGYKGFLLIRCGKCGHVRAFNSKYELNWYKCGECGEETALEELVPLWAQCECGRHSRYYTNIDTAMTEVNCITCGAPVAVEWNAKKKCYQTIQEEKRWD